MLLEVRKTNPEFIKALRSCTFVHELGPKGVPIIKLEQGGPKLKNEETLLRLFEEESSRAFKVMRKMGELRYADGKLIFSKMGEVPIEPHRIKGKVKRISIERGRSGEWYAVFQVEDEPKSLSDKVAGIVRSLLRRE